MRKVFTSPRLENVEAVAALLQDAGIQVKVSEARSYRGSRRSSFSYRESEDAGPQPAVWIIHAEDQPRGRQLLREAGLLDSSRAGESSYVPLSVLERDKDAQAAGKRSRAMRIKLGLLAAILVVIGLMVLTTRKPDAPATVAAAAPPVENPMPTIVPQSTEDLDSYRVDVPSALAKLLIEEKLAARAHRSRRASRSMARIHRRSSCRRCSRWQVPPCSLPRDARAKAPGTSTSTTT
ncbi:MAG: pathogenicity-like protein [Thermomonas sp.]|nr:pathogenicity-like protein [Thermomonas sp.]